jgi:hypothetical protein
MTTTPQEPGEEPDDPHDPDVAPTAPPEPAPSPEPDKLAEIVVLDRSDGTSRYARAGGELARPFGWSGRGRNHLAWPYVTG